MKKLLLTLSPFISLSLFTPLALVSCSQNSDENRIKEAKEKIAEIIDSKPQPTLSQLPDQAALINLEEYLTINEFVPPQSDIEGIKIELERIELPIANSTNLVIWLKVTSTDTQDIAAEISDFYSINFDEIAGIDSTKIQPINGSNLQIPFEGLFASKEKNIKSFVYEAISSTGTFEGEETIDLENLENDPKLLNDRLTSTIINENIFNNRQSNIYIEYFYYDPTIQNLDLSFKLGDSNDTNNVVEKKFTINSNEILRGEI